jgi:hypothetical protein
VAPHVPPIKIFEKLPHKNAIKQDPPTVVLKRRAHRKIGLKVIQLIKSI